MKGKEGFCFAWQRRMYSLRAGWSIQCTRLGEEKRREERDLIDPTAPWFHSRLFLQFNLRMHEWSLRKIVDHCGITSGFATCLVFATYRAAYRQGKVEPVAGVPKQISSDSRSLGVTTSYGCREPCVVQFSVCPPFAMRPTAGIGTRASSLPGRAPKDLKRGDDPPRVAHLRGQRSAFVHPSAAGFIEINRPSNLG